jgi:hypothetical protein
MRLLGELFGLCRPLNDCLERNAPGRDQTMSGKNLKIIGVLWVAGLVPFLQASPVHGFGLFDATPPNIAFADLFADLLTNADQFDSWDPDTPGGAVTTITYMFDPSFTTDERIREQVRLGIQQWDDASITPYGTTYSYLRNSGWQDFYDIREITVHELGHNLGFAHPFDVAPLDRNYGFDPTPPPTLVAVPERDDEVMSYGAAVNWGGGSYNQILSHDELNAYKYSYGDRNMGLTVRDLNFVEIPSGTPDILLKAEPLFFALAVGPSTTIPRDPADPTQGSEIISAEIIFATDSFIPLGFRTLGQNWDIQNTSGKATSGFEIQTRGTNNPTLVARFDGDPAGFYFDPQKSSTSSTGNPDQKDDLLHTWSDPSYWGFPADIPADAMFHIGLELDVWDWEVVPSSARAVHPNGTTTGVPLVSFSEWNETVTGVDVTTSSEGIIMPDPPEIVAGGIRLVNSEGVLAELVTIGIAIVDDMGLQLEDLNGDALNRLIDAGLFETFDIGPRSLGNGGEFFLVFDGIPSWIDTSDDPAGTSQDDKGLLTVVEENLPGIDNIIFLDRPDLFDHELFLYAETRTGDVVVGNYALLGTPPITLMHTPEPSTLALAAVGLLALLGCACRRRHRKRSEE